uniref:Uncharacterized protein n=1 Tax=Timema monikensis TaxID=170555 RepID=A0A7R9HSR1_9NEOP|nr:unnamed protein product [Timema monikensis]
MPRNYIKKKPPPPYSVETLQTAVADVENSNKTLREAATFYGIPATTIYYRIEGRKSSRDKIGSGRSTILDTATESLLVEYLIARSKLGYPCDKEELLDLVQEFVVNNTIKTPFVNNRPGHDWYTGFMKRHPSLSLKKAEMLQKVRIDARDPEVVYDFFDMLRRVYDEHEMKDRGDFIFNCDESGFPSDPSKLRALGEKGKPLSRVSGGSGKENTTVLACVSAAGVALPPLIVFKGAAVQARHISESAYPGTTYSATSNGWMEEAAFFNWMESLFIPKVQRLRTEKELPEQKAILLFDGHASHYSLRIVQAAVANNITLLKFPSHLTDRLQPLDKCVFGPIKTLWDKTLVEFGKKQVGVGCGRLTKEKFSEFLGKVWKEGMKPANIKNGFKTTGIFPFEPLKFDRELFHPSKLEAYEAKKTKEENKRRGAEKRQFVGLEEPTAVASKHPSPSKRLFEASTSAQADTEEIQAVALDLSLRIHGETPEKPASMIDIFASKIKNIPQRKELDELRPKTSAQNIRLKRQKYAEVLTTEEVIDRLKDAEASKIKKNNAKEDKKRKRQEKQMTKKKNTTESETEDEDDPEPVLNSGSEDNNLDQESCDDTFDSIDVEDFLEPLAGTEAKIEDFVLVEFKKSNPKEKCIYYIGKVTTVLEHELQISFMRKKTKTFVFPNVPDESIVPKTDVKKIFLSPVVRRGLYNFNLNFPTELSIR